MCGTDVDSKIKNGRIVCLPSNIFALTRKASEVTGINYVMDVDKDEVDEILS